MLDLLLFPLAFLIMSVLGEGKLAAAWRLITLGFMIRAVSDLIFSYITWQGLYLPAGNVNLISSLYDFGYAMSYPVLGLGIVAYRSLTEQEPAALQEPVEQPVTAWNFVLVSTDRANRIISFSENFPTLLGRTDDMPSVKGALLYGLLGLSENRLQVFVTELAERGFVEAMLVQVKDAAGNEMEARLSALAVYDAHQTFAGINMVISTLSSLSKQATLSLESQGVVRDILSKTGNLQKESRVALSAYFNAQMRMLDNLVHQYGGKTISQTMRMVINQTAMRSGWQVRKEGADFVFVDQPDIPALAAAMAALLQAARSYAIDMVGLQLVNIQVASLNTQINPEVMHAVESYHMRLEGS